MANIYRIKVGRLIEVRLDSDVRTPEDVDAWFNGFAAAARGLPPGARAVVIADWRACPLLSGDASERARLRLSQTNPRVERSAAFAVAESAITVLQFLRLCLDSGNPNRRCFTKLEPMVDWLGEVLTGPERQRLAEFLAEFDDGHASVPKRRVP